MNVMLETYVKNAHCILLQMLPLASIMHSTSNVLHVCEEYDPVCPPSHEAKESFQFPPGKLELASTTDQWPCAISAPTSYEYPHDGDHT